MSPSWPEVSLGALVREEREPIGSFDGDGRPVFGVTNRVGVTQTGVEASADRSQYLRLHPGRFVYNPYRINVGSLGVSAPDQEGIVSPAYVVFAPTERIDARFLYFFLKSTRGGQLVNFYGNRGSVRSALRFEDLCRLEIPLPALAEQRRVVMRIEALVGRISEARLLRQEAVKETEAFAKSVRNSSFAEAKARSGTRRLGELTTRITKGESPEWQGFIYEESGPMFIRSENVLWGKLDATKALHISETFHQKLSRSQLQCGDVLINLVGASIGRCCVVPEGLGAANVNQAVAVISPRVEEMSAEFLVHFLLSSAAQDEIHGGKVETARPNISLGDLRELEIPSPSLAEQRTLVADLDAWQGQVDVIRRLQGESGGGLEALLPAILDRAFKGELV